MCNSNRVLAVLLAAILTTACGGGGGGSGSSTTTGTTTSSSGGTGGSGSSSDTTKPVITIATPTSGSTYTATSSALSLSGSASDNVGVTQVSWSNSLGGSGTASGTASWSVNSVTLLNGTNTITVTARDAAGNTAANTLTVSYTTPDTTPPTVSSVSPANGTTNASTSTVITVTFSEAMNASSINTGTFTVNGATGTVSASSATATFTPSSALASSTSYTVTITGGTSGAKDAAGNALASNYVWTFTTSAPLACGTTVLCVDDTAGAAQEYSTIQAAVNVARAGDTVLVYDGIYSGFTISSSGTSSNPIAIKAQGSSAVINQANSSGEGITISNASYITIEGFTITGMSGYGMATHNASPTSPMHGLVIRNNTVQNSGSTNIYMSEVADSLIEGNSASGSAASHGIYLANGGSDNTILRGNRCFNNFKNGIHFNGDLSVGGDGLHSGLTVEDNVLYSNTDNGIDADGVQDSVFQNNLIYGNGRNALRVFGGGGADPNLAGDSAAGPKNLRIINNTLLTLGHSGWPVKLTEDLGGHVIFNNILLSDDSSKGSLCVANVNFASINNAVVNRFSLDGDTTLISLSAWQASGYDQNSFLTSASSLFVNTGANDYRLQAGAPAIDAGRTSLNSVSAPATDILSVARPQGSAYDIGAYESF